MSKNVCFHVSNKFLLINHSKITPTKYWTIFHITPLQPNLTPTLTLSHPFCFSTLSEATLLWQHPPPPSQFPLPNIQKKEGASYLKSQYTNAQWPLFLGYNTKHLKLTVAMEYTDSNCNHVSFILARMSPNGVISLHGYECLLNFKVRRHSILQISVCHFQNI